MAEKEQREEKCWELKCVSPGNVGDLWKISNINYSGLEFTVHAEPAKTRVIHYVRQSTKDLWNELEECRGLQSSKFSIFKVRGDPGLGKSTTVWGYTQFVGSKSPVAWVTQHLTGYHLALMAPEEESNDSMHGFGSFDGMKETIANHAPEMIVLDGIVATGPLAVCNLAFMLSSIMRLINHKCFFVVCSSLPSIDLYGAYLSDVPIYSYFMSGWTPEEILAARTAAINANQPVFPAALQNKADDTAFRRQLYVAGGNMEFFLNDYEAVKQHLRYTISAHKWEDLWWTARSFHDSGVSCLIVNTHQGEEKRFVNEFVYQEVSRLVPFEELDRAETLEPNNKAFMSLLFKLRNRKILEEAVVKEKNITFKKTQRMSFSTSFRIVKIVDDGEVTEGVGSKQPTMTTLCYMQIKWDEECFDVALIRRGKNDKYDVYFLHFSVSHRENVHLHYAADFLHRMFPKHKMKQQQQRLANITDAVQVPVRESDITQQGEIGASVAVETQNIAKMQLSTNNSPTCVVLPETSTKMKILVHYYFVLPKNRAFRFKLASCDIREVSSVKKFDPNFDEGKIRVTYVSSTNT